MRSTLLLNFDDEPLAVISLARAIGLLVSQRAIAVTSDESQPVHSPSGPLAAPRVVRLAQHVDVPYRPCVPLTRQGLITRDRGLCGYCGRPGNTVDHIVPRSRGGKHEWTNVVIACHRCNNIKADRTLAEIGWQLRNHPSEPAGSAWLAIGYADSEPAWAPYLLANAS